ncbi:hypothetical protein B0T17DRAFT_646769 [Bombardia bombarda]|uniref:DUF1989 domain-containing protein n=1 Tax=Bombardia bombarda TaxID=252184 RepID=A0AA39WGV9_9PEZI|nr:hypothetical protein B0T17DRAFT_646769 [Bombardia bombarda]
MSSSTPKPVPAYLPTAGSPLTIDPTIYTTIQSAPRQLLSSYRLPIRSGHAWTAPAGSIIRISTPEGPQVGDLNIWNQHNPRERFWASRTKQLHGSHVSVHDRLWSTLPYMRPMVTILSDTLSWYGRDEHGGRVHDLLGTRCDPYINSLLSGGAEYDFHCHSNLTRAVLPFGLTEFDVHDVINLFQVTGLDEKGRYFMSPCPAKAGDYIEFLAEQDVLMALSTCPGGDLSLWGFGSDSQKDMIKCCRPLQVEIYKLEDDDLLQKLGWQAAEPAKYRGMHGMTVTDELPDVGGAVIMNDRAPCDINTISRADYLDGGIGVVFDQFSPGDVFHQKRFAMAYHMKPLLKIDLGEGIALFQAAKPGRGEIVKAKRHS